MILVFLLILGSDGGQKQLVDSTDNLDSLDDLLLLI